MSLSLAAIVLGWLQDLRDVVVIIWGILGIVFFLAGIVVFYIIYRLAGNVVAMTTGLMDEHVKPIFTAVESTVQAARGTTAYVSDRLVSPVIRITAFAAGVRRGIAVLTDAVRRSRPAR